MKTKDFDKPTQKLKNGSYKMKSGLVYTCFSTDFLIEETAKILSWLYIKRDK